MIDDSIKSAAEQLPRRVRSFVRREGRITTAQQHALERLWPRYGLDPTLPCVYQAAFGRQAPLILEIGFGNGDSLAEHAAEHPDKNYIGIEVHRPGVGHLLMEIDKRQLTNLRIYCADAMEVLEQAFADHSLDGVQLYFPDPWPKKRHHKRRIVSERFVALLARKLKHGGTFHAATDWEDYANHMLEFLEPCPALRNEGGEKGFVDGQQLRPGTKFERRGRRLGHGVWDILYRRL